MQGANRSKNNINPPIQHQRSNAQRVSLGDFHLPQPKGPGVSSAISSSTVAELQMPAFGGSFNNPPPEPVLFSPYHTTTENSYAGNESHSKSTDVPVVDSYIETLAKVPKATPPVSNVVNTLERIVLPLNALETAHRAFKDTKTDMESGMSETESVVCNYAGSMAHGATALLFNGAVALSIEAGLIASAGVAATGVGTGNPAMAGLGLLGATATAHMAAPAFAGANDVAETTGKGVTEACHTAFAKSRSLTNGGL